MSQTVLVVALTPVVLFVLTLVVLNPAKRFIQRNMAEGKLKRVLLYRVN